jgi:hypothetical protein
MTDGAEASRLVGVHNYALSPPALPLFDVELDSYPFARIRDDVSATAWQRLEYAREDARALLAGRTLWSINSTARGGGIAEMQRTLWPYWRDAGLDARWLVLRGTPAFFGLTKRLHNLLHGCALARPGLRDHELFARVGRAAAAHGRAQTARKGIGCREREVGLGRAVVGDPDVPDLDAGRRRGDRHRARRSPEQPQPEPAVRPVRARPPVGSHHDEGRRPPLPRSP